MLQQQFRLKSPIDSNARFVPTPFFLLKLKENQMATSRFGFVISKRVAKSAVVRNRTRRLVRGVIEEELAHITQGYDMLFLIRQPLETAEPIKPLIVQALKKHNLWQEQA